MYSIVIIRTRRLRMFVVGRSGNVATGFSGRPHEGVFDEREAHRRELDKLLGVGGCQKTSGWVCTR
jgi:hypothetical protein